MAQSVTDSTRNLGVVFIMMALLCLAAGVGFGSVGALQYIFPDFLSELPFVKSRPLHVSLVVAWIFLSAVGGIYYYLPRFCNLPLFSTRLSKLHLWIFLITGLAILGSYVIGKFGGREYWEFPAVLAIPIVAGWILFGINYFKTVLGKAGKWPVYLWMWGTGIVFFLFTFLESYLWVIPYFSDHIVRDVTVQWKSYGALVGSWNMLVYGTAIFVMERISGDETTAKSKLSFLMYFLGFTNLLFGWAHHIYIVPSAPWIRYLAYGISMTELLILGKIIWNWRKTVKGAVEGFHHLSFRFLVASDFWIFLNLALALLISIPAVNIFTHGTHITVAHAMGSTIGINTTILLASCLFLLGDAARYTFSAWQRKLISAGYWIFNASLMLFWVALIWAGAEKGKLVVEGGHVHREIMAAISPQLTLFALSGFGILTGLLMIIAMALMVVEHFFSHRN